MSPSEQRCPQCGALLRGAAAWCTLCHADLSPVPAPEPAAAAVPAEAIDPLNAPLEQVLAQLGAPAGSAQAGAPAAVPVQPAPPVAEAPAPAPVEAPAEVRPDPEPELDDATRAALAAVGLDVARVAPSTSSEPPHPERIDDPDVMLALLRAQGQDPLLARFGGRVETKGGQAMVIVGGAAVLAIGLVVVFTLLGLIVG